MMDFCICILSPALEAQISYSNSNVLGGNIGQGIHIEDIIIIFSFKCLFSKYLLMGSYETKLLAFLSGCCIGQ